MSDWDMSGYYNEDEVQVLYEEQECTYDVGCMGCGEVVSNSELIGGADCPYCGGHHLISFYEAMGIIKNQEQYMESMGLIEEIE